jgi:hypothetical protein
MEESRLQDVKTQVSGESLQDVKPVFDKLVMKGSMQQSNPSKVRSRKCNNFQRFHQN